jgi:hypothetical protein
MSRAYTPGGRFSSDFERGSISNGIDNDLKNPVGTTALWYIYDAVNTTVDPIYDVGGDPVHEVGGKVWKGPFVLPVVRAVITQGQVKTSQMGYYNADLLHLTLNAVDIEKITPGVMDNPDAQDRSRVVWKGEVFRPYQSQQRAIISENFVLLSIDLIQVMPEELVNDPTFAAYTV